MSLFSKYKTLPCICLWAKRGKDAEFICNTIRTYAVTTVQNKCGFTGKIQLYNEGSYMKQDFMLKEGGICTRMELTVANPYTRRLPGCVGGICFHFSEIPKSSSLNEYIVSGTVSELRSFLRLKLPEWSLKDRYAYDLILDTVDGIKE